MVVSVIVEGYRWQMLPLFFVTIFIAALSAWDLVDAARPDPQRSRRQLIVTALMLLFIGIVALPAALLPVFDLPQPAGPFPVGVVSLDLVDECEKDIRKAFAAGAARVSIDFTEGRLRAAASCCRKAATNCPVPENHHGLNRMTRGG